MNHFDSTEFIEDEQAPERVYSPSEIREVLARLFRYYDGRVRSAMKTMRESVDAQSALSQAQVASSWECKRDTVLRVAENLEITLESGEK